MNKTDYTELFEEILKLETVEECRIFFDDLCTVNELEAMLQRIRSAKMILEGKTFAEVTEKTKISSATLARVSKAIKYGDGGYALILGRKKKKE
ncbi:MAG: YerC/YecD family TrpR-related protein [Bacilli bacterium]|nr:YerC/YecD family TrpR-related protein [Bacilli bacterium]